MPNRIAMKYVGKLFERFPLFTVILFSGFALGLAYGFWNTWGDFTSFQGHPKVTTLQDLGPLEPGKKVWVSLAGVEWKCANALNLENWRAFPLHDAVTGSLVVIQPQKDDQCGAGPLTGVLTRINPKYASALRGKGWTLVDDYPADRIYNLCISCTVEEAKMSLIVLSGCFLFSMSIVLLFLKKLNRQKNEIGRAHV